MSRIEKILQAMIDETSYDKAPQSRIEAILLAIKNNTQYSHLPHSRIEEILLAIKNNTSYDKEPMSRIEEILLAKLNSVEYKKPVQSKIEKLLLKWLYQDLYLTLKGVPPLTFTTNGQPLVDWTIYGNTTNGESVGDRTGNLFDVELVDNYHIGQDGLPSTYSGRCCITTPISINTESLVISYAAIGSVDTRCMYSVFLDGILVRRVTNVPTGQTIDTSGGDELYIGFYLRLGGKLNSNDISNIMLNEGSTALPYEPYGYRVPVTVTNEMDTLTTNIYLLEQIRKVGDEAEYADYQEQKLHRVRKNLLQNTASSQTKNGVTFTVNNDGSVTCNGTASNNTFFKIGDLSLASQSYILTGCPSNGGNNSYVLRCYKNGNIIGADVGNGFNINESIDGYIEIRIASGYTCNNLIFYPMIRKADIEDDTYESYITNTELDVTLPALPTLSGTNILSVGTQVQPSNMEIIYAPKEPELKFMMKKN